jgi:hypothetical protein
MTQERMRQRSPLKRLRTLTALLLPLSVSACGHDIDVIDACGIFPAPSWSSRDTIDTQIWFEGVGSMPGYAAKWDRLCGEKDG